MEYHFQKPSGFQHCETNIDFKKFGYEAYWHWQNIILDGRCKTKLVDGSLQISIIFRQHFAWYIEDWLVWKPSLWEDINFYIKRSTEMWLMEYIFRMIVSQGTFFQTVFAFLALPDE